MSAYTSLGRGVVPVPPDTYTPVAFGTMRRAPAPAIGLARLPDGTAHEVVCAINGMATFTGGAS